jgi:hypothetical protein
LKLYEAILDVSVKLIYTNRAYSLNSWNIYQNFAKIGSDSNYVENKLIYIWIYKVSWSINLNVKINLKKKLLFLISSIIN